MDQQWKLSDVIESELVNMISADIDTLCKNVIVRVHQEEHVDDALTQCISDLVRTIVRQQRSEVGQAPNRSRWDKASSALNEHFHPVMKRWESIGPNEWKTLGECTTDDILRIVDDRRARAAGLLRAADAYSQIHNLMIAKNASVVADLVGDEVAEVFAA